MRASLQHWLYSSLVFASVLFVGVDQIQALHNPDTQLPGENAGLPMRQKPADLTSADVEDLVPVLAQVLVPIFGPIGILRYPTKPISVAVEVLTVSICTYFHGVMSKVSSQVPQAYTTFKTEQQSEETMMEVIRSRAWKASLASTALSIGIMLPWVWTEERSGFPGRLTLSRLAPGRNFTCCSGIPGFGRGHGQGHSKYF